MGTQNRNLSKACFFCLIAMEGLGCSVSGGGLQTPQLAAAQLDSAGAIQFSGLETGVSGVAYLLADSTGAIPSSGNEESVAITDPAPLILLTATGGFFATSSGTCSLTALPAQPTASGDGIFTSIAAAGCTDQEQVTLGFDESQIQDFAGNIGTAEESLVFTVDLAPVITQAVTGNTSADGTGTTEAAPGVYSIGGDHSIIAVFSKSLAGGTFSGTLSGTGCTATLGPASVVSGSNGQSLVWTVQNPVNGQACLFNVSAVADALGNTDDPNDPNLSMNLSFQP